MTFGRIVLNQQHLLPNSVCYQKTEIVLRGQRDRVECRALMLDAGEMVNMHHRLGYLDSTSKGNVVAAGSSIAVVAVGEGFGQECLIHQQVHKQDSQETGIL